MTSYIDIFIISIHFPEVVLWEKNLCLEKNETKQSSVVFHTRWSTLDRNNVLEWSFLLKQNLYFISFLLAFLFSIGNKVFFYGILSSTKSKVCFLLERQSSVGNSVCTFWDSWSLNTLVYSFSDELLGLLVFILRQGPCSWGSFDSILLCVLPPTLLCDY